MKSGTNILVFNAGSSSLKFAVFHVDHDPRLLMAETIDGVGHAMGRLSGNDGSGGNIFSEQEPFASIECAARRAVKLLGQFDCPPPDAIGHRFVHGGRHLTDHALIDDGVIKNLEDGTAFAPQHNPTAPAILALTKSLFPCLPQVACIDTVFHKTMPAVARHFPLPADFAKRGILRYGFHGLSCESVVRRLPRPLPQRIIIAHLGSGCSITAVRDGISLDNSMGLTPMGGMMMATRTGDLDPGLFTHLMKFEGYTAASLETLFMQNSGLLGVSEMSADLRVLREAEGNSDTAKLAISMFRRSATKQIAAMIAAASGIDLLVFTGGIGEHDRNICDRISTALAWAGRFETVVMASKEDEQIAIHTARLVRASC